MSRKINPFDKNERGLSLYKQIKIDSEANSENIFTSLPLFIRIVLLEHSSWKYEQFNKYDLLNPFVVDYDFPKLITLSSRISYCKNIKYTQGKCQPKYIKVYDFLREKFLIIENTEYTIQDFVFSIAYNGSLHMDSGVEAERQKYSKIYTNFAEAYNDLAFTIFSDIASCFVQSFQEVYETFCESRNLMSSEHHHQPTIASEGKIIEENGEIATYYSNAYSQVGIDKFTGFSGLGIRFCLQLKLFDNPGNDKYHIFCYGNRKNIDSPRISCYQSQNRIFITAKCQSSNKSAQMIIPVENFMLNSLFWLEVSLYSKGFFIVAINEMLKKHEQLNESFSIYDGKVIVGASLEGNMFGKIILSKLLIESIDRLEYTEKISIFALKEVRGYAKRSLPHMLVKRPINVVF